MILHAEGMRGSGHSTVTGQGTSLQTVMVALLEIWTWRIRDSAYRERRTYQRIMLGAARALLVAL